MLKNVRLSVARNRLERCLWDRNRQWPLGAVRQRGYPGSASLGGVRSSYEAVK